MINLSEDYKKNIINMFPKIAEKWLKKIPLIVNKYIIKFNLQNVKVLDNLTYNTILFAESPKYGKVVLKVEIPFKEMTIRESEALIINGGYGACKCLFVDVDDGIVILERLTPGYALSTINDIDEKIAIFKEVADRFNLSVDEAYKGLPSYKEILMRSKNMADSDLKKYEIVKPLLDDAINIYDFIEQNNKCNYLLHSDLYSENIIKSGNTWKAIDPHGFIGPKILDETIFIQKELEDTNFDIDLLISFIEKMSKKCGQLCEELSQAFFVNYVLNICWDLEVNLSYEHINKSINKAYLIQQIIKESKKTDKQNIKKINEKKTNE